MGRKTKLTHKVIEDYCAARQTGATQTVAALYAGVSKATICGWTKKGLELRTALEEAQAAGAPTDDIIAPSDRKYIKFLNKVEEADASAVIEWLQVIQSATATNPTWAWRLLKQRYPDEYSEHDRLLSTVVNIDFSQLSNEQLVRIANGEDVYAVIAAGQSARDA